MQTPDDVDIRRCQVVGPRGQLGLAVGGRSLRGWILLLLMGASLSLSPPLRAAERYTLILKDGRRIDITAYEETGDRLYYYRYDARIGIARDKIRTIIPHAPSKDTAPLEDEILGRISRMHQRRFQLSDFLREDYVTAEIAPLMTPAEQQAYVRKLRYLKKMEIFQIDDRRLVAEADGDVVELAALEAKLIRALAEWRQGQEALLRLARRSTRDEHKDEPSILTAPPDHEAEPAAADPAAGDPPANLNELEKLHYRREMLRLVIGKHYQPGPQRGGFHARQQAEEALRIVTLQIRFFDRLPAAASPVSTPAIPVSDTPPPAPLSPDN